ncbi:YcaO-like family protein [Halonotius roseus]|uniref:Bacteriocin biosynthesis protein SagD n=1 Tax=Halonotius roseus TaxID=2511997 RepID=A0A544QL47_9EURY|nr:YcaO-like family protein [Halonotius roseus]TQQ79096.1 bacteriocin biosynthesis protein SagD [Halonotius roseus]
MELAVCGGGPAAEAIIAATEDIDAAVRRIAPDALQDGSATPPTTGAVVAPTGAAVFRAATDHFDRWVAVEIGGIGGYPIETLDAAVTTFGPDTACYRCLNQRVGAHEEATNTEPHGDRSRVRLAGAVAGNRLISLVAGGSDGGEITELPGPERRLLPVPNCDCASEPNPSRALPLTHRTVGVDDALARAEQAVDDRVGLVANVGERESFPVPYYIAEIADTTGFSDTAAADFAAGVDVDWDRAYMKAIGEALERYSAGVYRTQRATRGPERTLAAPVSPTAFVRPEGFEQPEPEQRIDWIKGQRLPDGESVSLPAEFIWFPPPNQRYRPAITTGLGLGNSPIGAVLAGLYEVIERDATMLAWYSTFEPLGLAIEDDVVAELRKRARAESLTVTPLLVTQDIDVPVVAAAVHREGEWPRFAVGSGANLDPVAAARSAIAESLQNWMELRSMGPKMAAEQSGAIAEYADLPAAAEAFVDPDSRIPADGLGDPDLTGEAELRAVCDRLAAVDLDAYAARLTTRDVDALGFEAVRAVVPAAQPLFTGEPYFGERARSVPESMGFEPRLDRSYHPYP